MTYHDTVQPRPTAAQPCPRRLHDASPTGTPPVATAVQPSGRLTPMASLTRFNHDPWSHPQVADASMTHRSPGLLRPCRTPVATAIQPSARLIPTMSYANGSAEAHGPRTRPLHLHDAPLPEAPLAQPDSGSGCRPAVGPANVDGLAHRGSPAVLGCIPACATPPRRIAAHVSPSPAGHEGRLPSSRQLPANVDDEVRRGS